MDEANALLDRLATAIAGGPPVVLGAPPDGPIPAGTALVVRTSGSSTGLGRPVALTARALAASADATHARLGGPGRWVLALPPQHIAGAQVLLRALRAGIAPALVPPGPFDPGSLTATLTALADDAPRYLSLVPTQLHRMLDAGGAALEALACCAAVLVGGAAAPAPLLAAARAAGVPVVVTYGMTETSGGCVYDGVPLPGVSVRLDDGRIWLAGPTLAQGYLDDGPQPFVEVDGVRWFGTADLGELDAQGRLQVLGRLDDVLVTGGVKVHPAAVERLLEPVTGEAVVVGVPDPEWGTLVTAVLTRPHALREVRDAVGGGSSAPRAVVVVPALPRLGPGKPDRREAAALARAAVAAGQAELLARPPR